MNLISLSLRVAFELGIDFAEACAHASMPKRSATVQCLYTK